MGGGLKKMGEGLLVAAAAVFKEKEEKKGWYLVEWWVIWGGCEMDVGWSKKCGVVWGGEGWTPLTLKVNKIIEEERQTGS
ncbi:hypothetical protein QVD17_00634 [Tagetes erecta]|uniref:Uncharacterized protein n=1 Tax=Tagetes erecta TaxID=13708 RepID=A0AAD8P0Q3_TARER|nr:hypothetical protein QVD17_00634 [Tagetes erecta]